MLTDIGPLTQASRAGVPALTSFLSGATPLLSRLGPYLGEVVPIVDYISAYRRELAAFFANNAAATEGVEQSLANSTLKHYARLAIPLGPESLAAYSQRPSNVRSNAYMAPRGYRLSKGLKVFGSYLCTSVPPAAIGSGVPASLQPILSSVYYGGGTPPSPPCRAQAPLSATLASVPGLSSLTAQFPSLEPLR